MHLNKHLEHQKQRRLNPPISLYRKLIHRTIRGGRDRIDFNSLITTALVYILLEDFSYVNRATPLMHYIAQFMGELPKKVVDLLLSGRYRQDIETLLVKEAIFNTTDLTQANLEQFLLNIVQKWVNAHYPLIK